MTSNDYLNLSSHPKIRKSMIQALEQGLDLSSSSSRLLAGTYPHHQETETLLQHFTGREAALSFSSGYLANVGVLPALCKNRVIFSDEFNHASLIDGIRLSSSPYHIYPHNDLNALENLLKKEKGEKIIVTESIFSMEGDFSPLQEISELALKYQALLFVDEAHATGLFGSQFSGLVYDLKTKDHIVSLHTGGKALGSSGAFIACSSLIKKYLVNTCRSFIFTTAPPPLLMIQWQQALKILQEESFRPLELRKKALHIRTRLNLQKNEIPILSIPLKDVDFSLKQAEYLRAQGYNVYAIRYPTVPPEKTGLRITLKYSHSLKDLEKLVTILKKIQQKSYAFN